MATDLYTCLFLYVLHSLESMSVCMREGVFVHVFMCVCMFASTCAYVLDVCVSVTKSMYVGRYASMHTCLVACVYVCGHVGV